MTRSTASEKRYQKYLRTLDSSVCQFCTLPSAQIIKEFTHFQLVKNIFPYDLWDSCEVLEHLLIIPKQHHTSKSEFSQEERAEFMEIISDYEGQGYNLYSRGHYSTMKSVLHQHSHLIKIDGNTRVQMFFYNKEPYTQIYR